MRLDATATMYDIACEQIELGANVAHDLDVMPSATGTHPDKPELRSVIPLAIASEIRISALFDKPGHLAGG